MSRRLVLLCVGLGLLGFSPPPAQATSFYERPFPDTVKDAPVIARGKVGITYTDWGRGEDSNKRIYTYWELQVQEALKGSLGHSGSIRMREMGGEKDGVGMQVSGTAHFETGETVVVMLSEKNSEGSYDVWGMMMGKYQLQKDESGTERLVGPGINGLTEPQVGDGEHSQIDTRGAKKWTLESLRRLIAESKEVPEKPVIRPSIRSVAPTPLAVRAASPAPSPVEIEAAPQLHNSPPEEESSSNALSWALGAATLAGLIWIFWIRRR